MKYDFDGWVDGYKVRYFNWVDGKRIYFNVQYFKPGQSISKSPVWDKTVFIAENDMADRAIEHLIHSLVNKVAHTEIKEGAEVTWTFQPNSYFGRA
jgi:hypothetical protein